jgi:5'-nucleotidase (lipoprotein e(P4) family)
MERLKKRFSLLLTIFIALTVLHIGGPLTATCNADGDYTTKDLNEQLVMATLWVQTSAEFRALCYQAFNLAKMNLDAFLSTYDGPKKVAISVDVDETLIDNSPYEAMLIGNNFGYSKGWGDWEKAGLATAYPGAVEFLNYCRLRGVEVFYITNIKMKYYEYASNTLKSLGFPFIDKKHLLFRTDTSNKQPRRDMVEKDYVIAVLLGDNLNDFLSIFSKKSIAARAAEADKLRGEWGKSFIVFPNPMYGDWVGTVYKGNWGASAAEKDQMAKESLKRWDYQP